MEAIAIPAHNDGEKIPTGAIEHKRLFLPKEDPELKPSGVTVGGVCRTFKLPTSHSDMI